MMRQICPCNGCKMRTETCHAKCGKYATWKDHLAELAKLKQAENDKRRDPARNKELFRKTGQL